MARFKRFFLSEALVLCTWLQLQEFGTRNKRSVTLALVVMALCAFVRPGQAQFMRLGPFDLDATTSVDFIYTTNVDGARRSESTLEQEDYYLVWSLGMILSGPTTPTAELTIDTSMSIEKHFVRDDLDTSSDPFGNVLLTHQMELGRFDLPTTLQFTRENTQDADGTTRLYIPGQRRERIVQDTRLVSQGVNWRRDPFALTSLYSYRQIRFVDSDFQDGDEDEHTFNFGVTWDMIRWGGQQRLNSFYNYSQDKTDLINRPDSPGSGEWERRHAVGLNFQILTRPNAAYAIAYEKDDDEDWRVTHTFTISDEWALSPVMILDANAQYRRDEQPREDDIAFTYSAGLSHEVGRTLNHSVRVTREPVDTFGSTTDTDSTRINYTLTKTDLFFANLAFNGGITHEINKPQGEDAGPREEITRYFAGLTHSAALSRRLSRNFAYQYSYETSNLESEPIEEHRVILGLVFTF